MATMTFLHALEAGAVVMAPMTKGSNLPYRRLCQELGADVTMSEMAVVRRLQQRSRGEFALIQRAADERCFGVQLAGKTPDDLAWGAALVEERGADLVDLNLGCPIDEFTRRGLGSALLRRPGRVRTLVEAMKRGVSRIPVTVKIRLGWNDEELNAVDVARAAVDGGADALVVHGRTRNARYRRAADWEAIGRVADAVSIPVIGNGDLLYPEDFTTARATSGCRSVMVARGALIKPWIFAEAAGRPFDESPESRLTVYRRYVELGLAHWGVDERGREKFKAFLVWHLGFWCRFIPRDADGSYVPMQERAAHVHPRSAMESLLARTDAAAHGWVADRLLAGDAIDADAAPPPPPDPPADQRTDRRTDGRAERHTDRHRERRGTAAETPAG
jgi:tRNA-dihydrouridine synthase 3